jgi:hypothetical protein
MNTEQKYNELFTEDGPIYAAFPEGVQLNKDIHYMMAKDREYFSFTRVIPTSDVATRYLNKLGDMKKIGHVDVRSWRYLSNRPGVSHISFPRLIMLATQTSSGAIDMASSKLVDMVEKCPKGRLGEIFQESFEEELGGKSVYDQWMQTVAESLKRSGSDRVIRIDYGPKVMHRDDVKKHSNLFLFPGWQE